MPVVTTTRITKTTVFSSDGGDPHVNTTTTTTTSGQKNGSSQPMATASVAELVNAKPLNPRAALVRAKLGDEGALNPEKGLSPNTPLTAGRGGASVSGATYDKIAQDLLAKKALFEDSEFPADDTSLFMNQKLPMKVEWKRPHDLCSRPEFIDSQGASRFDVKQGQLGDCWLLAAVASLSLHSELFNRVVPPDQFFNKNYCGMFKFHFWSFGEWREVVVDDRLPTYRGELVFMHSAEKSEFWSALLEKAYAKLIGSYEALRGGTQSEAMEDFTGGITEVFEFKQKVPKNLFDIMLKAQSRSSLMGCSIDADPNQVEAKLANGLVMGHAYSVTDVRNMNIQIPGKSGKIQMVRCRNPWGSEDEWKGSWGDKSPEWQYISETDRKSMGLVFDNDGEFWMSFQDFVKNFQKLEICHLGPQSMEGDELQGTKKRRWEMNVENGSWKKKLNAGGCRNYLNTFWTNPQYRVTVVDPDDDDDDNKGTLIIGLMQKNMRKRMREGVQCHTIGYAIYGLDDPKVGPLDVNFFKYHASVDKSPAFINTREVCGRHKLLPGTYCIVPSTFEPDQEAEFLLRIFSEKPNESAELDSETGIKNVTPAVVQAKEEKVKVAEDESQNAALREAFKNVAGEDMEIDATELQNILNTAFSKEFNFDGFSRETCRSMLSMMDVDQSGKLGFDEFKSLWNDLRLWKTVFKKYDVDKSGNFNSFELRQTLAAVGYSVSNAIFSSLVMRFASKDGVIYFDDYILICARLKTIFETFEAQPKTAKGEAAFSKDLFIQCVMYS